MHRGPMGRHVSMSGAIFWVGPVIYNDALMPSQTRSPFYACFFVGGISGEEFMRTCSSTVGQTFFLKMYHVSPIDNGDFNCHVSAL